MEEKRISALIIVATTNATTGLATIVKEIINMFGTLNAEQDDENIGMISIKYQVQEAQMKDALEYLREHNYEGFFIIAPEECENIHSDYIEL